jgi:NAD(P)-dependent dehydrogenase (short-subunit alcohol dehydrogenase family)
VYWEVFARQPIPRIGQPAEIAEVALLIASERGSYMTGQTVVVDGGLLLSLL